jgi:hypothetical protein
MATNWSRPASHHAYGVVGMRWIRNTTRLCIYLRDGFRCVYCDVMPERPQLDHVLPTDSGGQNDPDNLVTCCNACNNRKGNRSLDAWALSLGTQEGRRVRQRVAAATFQQIDRAAGRALERVRPRGTFAGRVLLPLVAEKGSIDVVCAAE